ncbi:polysaccharide deacetylase family protein [Rhizobium straminoryzae]|uniref:Chitooligosaccharide deacetylase n=1 Tax=Rhizobium straminoryzae TaxID=1387186 RepID=A0A549T9D7_9HYPH|nr:polysaccharide deacetylase family protein [Rhizobium straminoryzae]TRL38465.1 polysaccharide deacetylase family protein [Rhizobium straminoryzae]
MTRFLSSLASLLLTAAVATPVFALDSAAVPAQVSPLPKVPAQAPAIRAAKLLEPTLRLPKSKIPGEVRVALTFDACMGDVDQRILSVLVSEKIPATIFVTARWLRRNPQTLAVFKAHPEQFELENHGENHVPAVDQPMQIYGIAAAGSPQAVEREVAGGAGAMLAASLPAPRWFRGATAKYDVSAMTQIRGMGFRIAGYSVNGDGGSLLGAAMSEKHIAGARDGDVVLAHINQPTHAAGEGVAQGILALKRRGVTFVRLADVPDLTDETLMH